MSQDGGAELKVSSKERFRFLVFVVKLLLTAVNVQIEKADISITLVTKNHKS